MVGRLFRSSPVVMLIALAVSACDEEKVAEKPVVRAVKTVVAKPVEASERRRVSGLVEAVNTTAVAFEVGGNVVQVRVRVGDRVRKGGLLARLDDRQYQLNVQSAGAEVRRAEADLTDKKSRYEAQKQLFEKKVAAKSAFDRATAEYKAAQESVNQARSRLELSKRDLAKTILRSPMEGTVTKREVDPANVVAAGKIVLELQGAGAMQVKVNVSDRMVGALKKGRQTVIRYPSFPQLKHVGIIDEISARAGEANTFPVTVRIAQAGPDIRSGMAAEVTFTLEIPGFKTAFALPVSAFLPSGNETRRGHVFVVETGGPKKPTLKKRAVTVVAIRGNDVLIGKGIDKGERIVVAGVSFLYDGMTVKLLKPQK